MFLVNRARLGPDKTGLVYQDKEFTYGEFNERSNHLAHALIKSGIRAGDRIGILLANCNEFLEAYFAIAKTGAISVPLNWRLTSDELQYICNDCRIETLFFGEEFLQKIATLKAKLAIKCYICVGESTEASPWAKYDDYVASFPRNEPTPAAWNDDPAVIMYTSGTTGRPKGAVLTHQNLFWWALNLVSTLDIRMADRGLLISPIFHSIALLWSLGYVYKGCTIVLVRGSPFDPLKLLATIQKERINEFIASPPIFQRMAQVQNFETHLNSIRWLVSGGAPLARSTVQAYARCNIKLMQMYGMGEVGAISTICIPDKAVQKAGSVGTPMFHNTVRIVDQDDRDIAPGQTGEVICKGPMVMKEYWGNPQATKETIKNGWLHTGDLASIDQDGYLYIVDRKKDMIVSGGEHIYPAEVENLLLEHPAIAEVAVIGQPDEMWGESACAIVRLAPDRKLTAEEVVNFCQGKLAKFKFPKRVVFTDQPLPRNPAGKILKQALRKQLNPIKEC
jgi:fatty-acyl-CoA synthase